MPRDRDDDRDDDRPRRRRDDDDRDEDRPRRRRRDDDGPAPKETNVLGIFGMIAGIVSLLVSFIPFVGMFAFIPGLIAIAKSTIALIIAKVSGRMGTGFALTGIILGGVAILIGVLQFVILIAFAASLPTTPKPSVSTPADATVTAVELDSAYAKNVASADAMYKGKTIDVTGTVERVADDVRKFRLTVELTGFDGSTVDCDFSTADKAVLGNLKEGSTVTIRGKCVGRKTVDHEKWVTLENCVIVPADGGAKATDAKAALKVTSEQLRKEYIDDAAKASAKFSDKSVEVSGEVTGIDHSTPDAVVVGLGFGKMGHVQCVFDKKAAAGLAGVKEGQRVSVRGTCVGNEDALAFVTVKDCTLVK